MKKNFGLIVFKDTTNIGDDIQSYSAIRFLPQIDYYIEREKLNEFISNNGEKVNVIMNGWYLHDIASFPPSPYINPYFISIHLTDHLYGKCPEYLTGLFEEYLRKYSPIGCRDNVVSQYLNEKKIDNYWSGCITLTIEKFEGLEKEDYICAVDLNKEELEHLRKVSKKEVKVISHKLDKNENSKLTYDERMRNVEDLLKTYQKASLIVTNRLHASLPSLALETPVLLIHDEENIDEKNRLGIYLELLNHTTSQKFIDGFNDDDIINIKPNKKDYLKIRQNIIKNIDDFIKNKTIEYKPDENSIKYYQEFFIKQKQYLTEILKNQKEEDIKIRDEWMNKEYEEKIDNLKKEYDSKYKNLEYEMKRLENKFALREEVYNKEIEILIENYSNKSKNKIKNIYYNIKSKLKNFLRRCKRFVIKCLKRGK